MKTFKHSSVDCGFYVIAAEICMLFNEDPTGFVFDQKELRLHLVEVLKTKSISSFPILKPGDMRNEYAKFSSVKFFCLCILSDNRDEMISCDKCQQWFHLECLNMTKLPTTDEWFCLTVQISETYKLIVFVT